MSMVTKRARPTRPAERYRWSSYRCYVGGRVVGLRVTTGPVLAGFGGDPDRYRADVGSGKGEKQVSPFVRAVAGVALGGEAFVARARAMVRGGNDDGDQPSLAAL